MRKIIIAENISLDGVIQPGGPDENNDYVHGGWTAPYRTPEGAAAVANAYGKGFDLLLGRRTYDLFASYWPKITGGPFAEGINSATKYVATHRAENLTWGPVEDLGADAINGIRSLKAKDGPGLVVCGSATLTTVLLEQGLVDEMLLVIYPVLLGHGKRPFPGSINPSKFALASSVTTPAGVLINHYRTVSDS